MHPRNIYNKRLDFKALADEFPELRKHTVLDLKGRLALDFRDLEALRALSKTLLKRDFNLDVYFPQNGLIPTIPLRLNYILFIEDLLKLINRIETIKGLDIGTGASCIYSLISARKNKWHMIGSDINSNAVECAQQNIATNTLSHLIQVVQVKEGSILEEILKRDDTRYDFCMCNPPFFGNPNELCSQLKRKLNRPLPKNAFVAEMHEVLTEGGEFAFISKMIDESKIFHDRIRVYTSMVGIKRNIKPLLEKLQRMPYVKSTTVTEFHQGNTTRFGIAWTFDNSSNLQRLSYSAEKKTKNKPYVHSIQPFNESIEKVDEQFRKIFDDLQLTYHAAEQSHKNTILYEIQAHDNTWSHSRRKRRELARNMNSNHEVINIGNQDAAAIKIDLVNRMKSNEVLTCLDGGSSGKRKCDSSTQDLKRVKIGEKDILLKCTIAIYVDSELVIEVNYLDGLGGKDACHQILQYLKNHLKFPHSRAI